MPGKVNWKSTRNRTPANPSGLRECEISKKLNYKNQQELVIEADCSNKSIR